jgi:hypothetical protein
MYYRLVLLFMELSIIIRSINLILKARYLLSHISRLLQNFRLTTVSPILNQFSPVHIIMPYLFFI